MSKSNLVVQEIAEHLNIELGDVSKVTVQNQEMLVRRHKEKEANNELF